MATDPQDRPCPATAPFLVRRDGTMGDELFHAVTAHPEHAGRSFEEMRVGSYGGEWIGGGGGWKAAVLDGHAPARLPFARGSVFPLPSFRDGVAKRTR